MSQKFSTIGSGKHQGHTLPWVLLNNTNYFFWAIQEKKWLDQKHLKDQITLLNYRSRNILIPGNENGLFQAHYLVPKIRKVLRKVLVLPLCEEPPSNAILGGSFDVSLISDVIDLSHPWKLAPDDRHHGPRSALEAVSNCYFGVPDIVWDDETLCQHFFSEERNFRQLT